MWNPFKVPVGVTAGPAPGAAPPTMGSGAYADGGYAEPDATDYFVLPNQEQLNDANYPDATVFTNYDNLDDLFQTPGLAPGWLGTVGRTITSPPGQADLHSFLSPAPGSNDLIAPRDTGGVPGTAYWNDNGGPVSGNAMDDYKDVRQGLLSLPPGQGGPVSGNQYSLDTQAAVAAAQFQAAFATQSNAAADAAMVNGI